MPYITALQPTFVKMSTAMSGRLDDTQKALIKPGQELAIVTCERNGNHSKVTFSGRLTIGGTPIESAWIYTPSDPKLRHWDGLEVFQAAAIATHSYYSKQGSADFIIPVPYQSQIGNDESLFGPDWRQCMLTSVSEAIRVVLGEQKVAEAIRVAGVREWEEVYAKVLYRFGDTTVADAHIQALASMGIKARMRYDGTPEIIRSILRKGIPVPAGFRWSSDGHWRVIVGFNDDGSFIIDDPYGKYDFAASRQGIDNYISIGSGGQHLRFTAQDMQNTWNDLGPAKGWFIEILNEPHSSIQNKAKAVASVKEKTSEWIAKAVNAMAHPELPQDEIDLLINMCIQYFPEYGITTRERIIHFFAQTGKESMGFWWLEEQGDYEYFESNYGINVRDDLGNEKVGDGAKYSGRGLGQVTGKGNYQLVMDATGIDYINHPELMAQYPGALVGFLIWWKRNDMNSLCDCGLDDAEVNAVGGRINGKNPPNGANDRLNRSDKLKLLIV